MYFETSKKVILLITTGLFIFSSSPTLGKVLGSRCKGLLTQKSGAQISGTLKDSDTGAPIAGVPIKIVKKDNTILKRQMTSFYPDGQFLFRDLADGIYHIYLDGYEFKKPVTISVSDGKNINGLFLPAEKAIKNNKKVYEKDLIPDHNPAITKDEAGNLYLVWEHGNELWWAINKGKGWDNGGEIPDAEGTNPIICYDHGLLEQGSSPGLFCAWETISSPKKILCSVARPGNGKITWSKPKALTGDDQDDYGLALAMDKNHSPVILWLQQASIMEDDADLYYRVVSPQDLPLDWGDKVQQNQEEPVPEPVAPFETANCYEHVFAHGEFLVPRIIPIIGGVKGFSLSGDICADPGFDTQSAPTTPFIFPLFLTDLYFSFSHGKHLETNTTVFALTEAVVATNAGQTEDPVKETTNSFGGSHQTDFLSFPFPLFLCLLPVGRARFGVTLQAGADINFIQRPGSPKSQAKAALLFNKFFEDKITASSVQMPNSSSLPDEIVFVMEVTMGGVGTISSFRGRIEGKIFAVGGLTNEYSVASSSSKFLVAPFITVAGWVGVGGWNGVYRTFDKTTVFDEKAFQFPREDPNIPMDPNTFIHPDTPIADPDTNTNTKLSLKNLIAKSGKDNLLKRTFGLLEEDVSVYEELEFVKKSFEGTKAIYEGNTVLVDANNDIYHDGLPSLATDKSGKIILAWIKDFASSCLGTKVFSAEYDGNNWSKPVEVTPDINFNTDTAVVFDSYDIPMIVWSSASNHGLDYEKSPVAEILEAIDKADLMYAQRIEGKWAVPKTLAALRGKDEQVCLAAGPHGEITAAWINSIPAGSSLYSSHWDGKKWSEPSLITKAALAESPEVIYQAEKPLVIWSQDADSNLHTFDDWTFYFSSRDGLSWSSPYPLLMKVGKYRFSDK